MQKKKIFSQIYFIDEDVPSAIAYRYCCPKCEGHYVESTRQLLNTQVAELEESVTGLHQNKTYLSFTKENIDVPAGGCPKILRNLTLYCLNCFSRSFSRHYLKISSFRLLTHSRDAHGKFFYGPFK